jgi:hypothetical protein
MHCPISSFGLIFGQKSDNFFRPSGKSFGSLEENQLATFSSEQKNDQNRSRNHNSLISQHIVFLNVPRMPDVTNKKYTQHFGLILNQNLPVLNGATTLSITAFSTTAESCRSASMALISYSGPPHFCLTYCR